MKYVYTLANGKKETVYVDMSELVDQAEVENGIQAINGKLSVKIDNTGEDFLTVSTDGVKLSGVQTAIDTAKNEVIGGATTGTLKGLEDKIEELDTKVQKAHTVVNGKDTGHITVTVADSDDSTHKVVTIGEMILLLRLHLIKRLLVPKVKNKNYREELILLNLR